MFVAILCARIVGVFLMAYSASGFVFRFILCFIVAVVVNTYLLKGVPEVGKAISGLARKGLIVTMFFIGASLSTDVLKSVGVKPLIQGVLLWLLISVGSLLYIMN